MSTEDQPLITISEIVTKYGVARKTVQRWVDAEKIKPAQTLPGRTGAHLFTVEAAEKAFANHKATVSTEPAEEAVSQTA